jgi:hypothetical protein
VDEYPDPLAGLWDTDVVTDSAGVQAFRLEVPDAILQEQQALMWVPSVPDHHIVAADGNATRGPRPPFLRRLVGS